MGSSQTKKTNGVFIDSSVLFAAAASEKGAGRELLRQGLRGQLDLYIAPTVLEESERNLALKLPDALTAFRAFCDFLNAHLVDPPQALVLEAASVVALKDAPIVAAASQADTLYLATYDRKHLLRAKEAISARFGIVVALPEEILAATRPSGCPPGG